MAPRREPPKTFDQLVVERLRHYNATQTLRDAVEVIALEGLGNNSQIIGELRRLVLIIDGRFQESHQHTIR